MKRIDDEKSRNGGEERGELRLRGTHTTGDGRPRVVTGRGYWSCALPEEKRAGTSVLQKVSETSALPNAVGNQGDFTGGCGTVPVGVASLAAAGASRVAWSPLPGSGAENTGA